MSLFGERRTHNVAVLDISSGSVGGALVARRGGVSTFISSARVYIRPQGDPLIMLVRALGELSYTLLHHAPRLKEVTGSAHIDSVHVMLGAPWQETKTSLKVLEEGKPFLITKDVMKKVLEEGVDTHDVVAQVLIQSAKLNGYVVASPLGKLVSRAEFSLLTSIIQKDVHDKIAKSVRTLSPKTVFVEKSVFLAETLQTISPKTRDALVLHVSEEDTCIVATKDGKPYVIRRFPVGTAAFDKVGRQSGAALIRAHTIIDMTRNEKLQEAVQKVEQTWLATLINQCKDIGATGELPRTIFLFAENDARDYLKRVLEKPPLKSLWLESGSPQIIPVLPSLFAKRLATEQSTEFDAVLGALGLYALSHLP